MTELPPDRMKKRSVVVANHRTSVSLENVYWDALFEAADLRALSVNELVTEIIANGVKDNPQSLKAALAAGLRNMAPSAIALDNTLRLVTAMRHSMGDNVIFAFLRTEGASAV